MNIKGDILLAAILAAAVCLSQGHASAQAIEVPMHRVDETGIHELIGIVTVAASPDGVTFTPALEGLPPGPHGFHVHARPSCEPAMDPDKVSGSAAFAAGPHLDPDGTKRHRGPREEGHLGDLPALEVDSRGMATAAVLAPRLKMRDLNGHALIIHQGADSYSDEPEKLGGGGEPIACGIIKVIATTQDEAGQILSSR